MFVRAIKPVKKLVRYLHVSTPKKNNILDTIIDTAHYSIGGTVGVTALAATGMYLKNSYIVCKPNQYVVKTGMFVKDVQYAKKTLVLPLQDSTVVDVNPQTYFFRLHNMSKEKVEFELPIAMTIGPHIPEENEESFIKYCKLLQETSTEELRNTVQGIIEGETRGLTAQLTIEEMFNGKDVFRKKVVTKLEGDLNKFGLRIYNANIQEMRDYDAQNKYFEYRKQRAIQMANNEARRDVAEAEKQGNVAVAERERDTRIKYAKYNQEAKNEELENEKMILVKQAEVAKQNALTRQITNIANMEADQRVKIIEQELQQEIEAKRFEQTIQEKKSVLLASALAEAESIKAIADANLYQETKKAEGIYKNMEAKADGINKLYESCGGNADFAKFYLSIDSQLFKSMFEENAKAVQGLNPNMTIWNTGNSDGIKPLVNMVQGFVPLYKEVQKVLMPKETPKKN